MSVRVGTLSRSGPVRFALEAAFIILVGVAAALLDLRPVAIAVVVGLALVVVALAEGATRATRRRRAPTREARRLEEPEPEPDERRQPEPQPQPPPEPQAEPRRRLRFSEPRPTAAPPEMSREWNLWELERRAREHAGADAVPEEWAAMFMYLRDYANADGRLPPQFDSLVRESFPELTGAR